MGGDLGEGLAHRGHRAMPVARLEVQREDGESSGHGSRRREAYEVRIDGDDVLVGA